MQRMIAVFAMAVSVCSSADIQHIPCRRIRDCEARAEKICGSKNYRLYGRSTEEAEPSRISDSTATDIGGALSRGGAHSGLRVNDTIPVYTVDCNPPTRREVTSTTTIYAKPSAEEIAAYEKAKKEFIGAVCELRDPQMRQAELQIARETYGPDVSCDE